MKKMKTKIIGILMAAIMLAFVVAAIAPTASAEVLPNTSYNGLTNDITLANSTAPTTYSVLIGQKLNFLNGVGSESIQGDPASDTVAGELFTANPDSQFSTAVMTKTGIYYVNATVSGTTVSYAYAKLAVANPTMSLKLKSSGTEVSSITEGTALQASLTNNLNGKDMVSLVITDPGGNTITSTSTPSQNFSKINVSTLTGTYGATGINTTGWDLGTYTFKVSTKSNNAWGLGARGLSMSSNEATVTLLKSTIAIEAEKTSAVELETVKLTVTGTAGHLIAISTSDTTHAVFPGGSNDNPAAECTSFTKSIDADGKRTYSILFDETGSYTITVNDTSATGFPTDTVDISVTEKAVTFDIPSTVTIGSKVTIKGTANTGSTVDVAVEGTMYILLDDIVIDENGEFSKEIDTATAGVSAFSVPGSVRLKAYIDRTVSIDIVTTETDDGSVAILMVRGGLTAELSGDSVAQDDDFTVSGTAKGSKSVDILIISPKGIGGTKVDGSGSGIYETTSSVSDADDTYSKKISVGANVDTGSYLVVVLSPGSDSQYSKFTSTGTGTFVTRLTSQGGYITTAKTYEQLLEIIQDATVNAAGSDDLIWVGYIKVATPFVTLDSIASVGVGEPLVVTGTSNRKEGFSIVVTVKGPVELTPQTVTVENGVFTATFDTTGKTVGTYTVKADDGDGHTDEATVEILTAAPVATATPAPTAAPTATPYVPTPATPAPATPAPATPTPEPPGFEAVFAIAGLLAVAYLVLRIKK